MIHNDYESDYKSVSELEVNGNPTTEIRLEKQQAIEIFKMVNNLNSDFIYLHI